MYNEKKTLIQFYLTEWCHTHTHTHTQKKWTPSGLYSVLQPRRIVQLGEQSLAGYLSASCGHTDSNPPRWDSNPRAHDPGCSTTTTTRSPAKDRRPQSQTPTMTDQSNGHDDSSTLLLTTTLLSSFARSEGFLPLATRLLIGRWRTFHRAGRGHPEVTRLWIGWGRTSHLAGRGHPEVTRLRSGRGLMRYS